MIRHGAFNIGDITEITLLRRRRRLGSGVITHRLVRGADRRVLLSLRSSFWSDEMMEVLIERLVQQRRLDSSHGNTNEL